MPNPARPNFRDVIDTQWGVLTADRIVRRYATDAERDADLAGISDLEGQLIAMTDPNDLPFKGMRGGAWFGIPLMQVVTFTVATGPNGNIDNWPFPVPFPNSCLSVIACSGDGMSSTVLVAYSQVTRTKAGYVAYRSDGVPVPGQVVRINYVAFGT